MPHRIPALVEGQAQILNLLEDLANKLDANAASSANRHEELKARVEKLDEKVEHLARATVTLAENDAKQASMLMAHAGLISDLHNKAIAATEAARSATENSRAAKQSYSDLSREWRDAQEAMIATDRRRNEWVDGKFDSIDLKLGEIDQRGSLVLAENQGQTSELAKLVKSRWLTILIGIATFLGTLANALLHK